jgi:hypothetical protein
LEVITATPLSIKGYAKITFVENFVILPDRNNNLQLVEEGAQELVTGFFLAACNDASIGMLTQ